MMHEEGSHDGEWRRSSHGGGGGRYLAERADAVSPAHQKTTSAHDGRNVRTPLEQEDLLVATAALIWLLAVRITWRWRLLGRYLSVDIGAA